MERLYPGEEAAKKLKAEGNAELGKGNHAAAEALYRKALEISPHNHVLLGNLTQALLNQGRFDDAYRASVATAALCPKWHKAHFRRGAALHGLQQHPAALAGMPKEP